MVNKHIDTVTIIKLGMDESVKELKFPIYRLIAFSISNAIENRLLINNSKLPPVRVLADGLSVTPGTITRAYEVLEKDNLIIKKIGDGCYVNICHSQYSNDFSNTSISTSTQFDLRLNTHIDVGNAQVFSDFLRKYSVSHPFSVNVNNYSPEDGLYSYKQAGVKYLSLCNVDSTPNNLIVTMGAQHALFILLASMVKSGGYVAASKLSYPGLITASRTLNIKLIGLDFDDEGITLESLLQAVEKYPIQLLYLTPTMDNPTTITMSLERRRSIAAICEKSNIKIITDETLGVISPIQLINFSDLYPSGTFVISSVSKVLGPGLKVGFIHSPLHYIQHILAVTKSISWSGDNLATDMTCKAILDGVAFKLRENQYREIQNRINLIRPYLEQIGAKYNEYCGHFWVDLEAPWRASELEYELKKRNVLIKTAESFAIGRLEIPQGVRIGICKPTEQQLGEAILILIDVLNS